METFCLDKLDFRNVGMYLQYQIWRRNSVRTPHRHDCTEIVFMDGGLGVNCVNEKKYPIMAGDVYVISRNAVHSFYTSSELRFYNLLIEPSRFTQLELEQLRQFPAYAGTFENLDEQGGLCLLRLNPTRREDIKMHFAQLAAAYAAKGPGHALVVHARLVLLMAALCHAAETAGELDYGENRNSPIYRNLHSLLDFIAQHYRERISLKCIGNNLHLPEKYVSVFFKEQTGTSLVKYINSLRLDYACRLLQDGKHNVTDAALLSGFTDSSYFARYFRAVMHCSPSDFQKKSRKEQGVIRKKVLV